MNLALPISNGPDRSKLIGLRAVAGLTALICLGGVVSSLADVPGIYTGWGATNLVTTNAAALVGPIQQIKAGSEHALALRTDGTVVAWGLNTAGQTNIPVGLTNVIAISAGGRNNLALRRDGTVVAWGAGSAGQTNIPPGLNDIAAVAAGADFHNVLLRSNGLVVVLGNIGTYTNQPTNLTSVVAIGAGPFATLAVRSNGTVAAWGNNTYGLTNLPTTLTNVTAVSVGLSHCLALRTNGTVIAWGDNSYGQTIVPANATNIVAISAGWLHSLVLRSDGTLLAWGLSTSGQTSIPANLTNVTSFSAGNALNLAIDPAPRFIARPAATVTLAPGQATNLVVATLSGSAANLQWQFNGNLMPGETNTTFAITNFSPAKAGVYTAVLSNAYAVAAAATIVRLSNAPTISVNGVILGGGGIGLTNSAIISLAATTNAYAKLFYTLDGSEPDFTSANYTAPFVISNTVNLRALAYNTAFTDRAEAAPLALQVIPSYPLITSSPGGSLVITPPPNSGANSYLSNTLVTLTATPSNGWSFLYWTGSVAATSSVLNVAMNSTQTLQAVFGTSLNLFTNGAGRIVTAPTAGPFPYGSVVSLTALPDPGNYFFGWAGVLTGITNPATITVNNASGITALFASLKTNQVSLVALPVGGGSLNFSPAKNVYTNGEVVVITAVQTTNRVFSFWSGDATGAANPLSVTLTSSQLIYGNFIPGNPTNRPAFVAWPPGRSLGLGGSTVLSALATGDAPITYQWRLNSTALSGATGTNLVVSAFTPAQAGWYDVVATGFYGATTSPAAPIALLGLDLAPGVSQAFPLLTIDCAPGARFQLQYLDSLSSTNWAALQSLLMNSSREYFIDNTPSNPPQRFYRLVPQ